MVIRELRIKNFRGIESMEWRPAASLVCIVGPGDSGKSTLLDAIEAALGTGWVSFTDADFTDGDVTRPIEITATVGQLPAEALRDTRLGLSLRGWTSDGELHDEPTGDDEGVVTVCLSVDATLEPVWTLLTDRSEPRLLSGRDRTLFGVVRLGAEVERHLNWGQGSALARLTADKQKAAPLLAEARRKAKEALGDGSLPWLTDVAAQVRGQAEKLGAHIGNAYSAGLDGTRGSISLAALALHADGIPVRLAGLGSRRLVALAAQYLSIPEGAILLIDEVEHGLEPHRIRHGLRVLRDLVLEGQEDSPGRGQVILTTHSPTPLVELSCPQLAVAHRNGGTLHLHQPAPVLQATVRRVPDAFLARRLIVCEGRTEIGLLWGLRSIWAKRHDSLAIEAIGVALVDGQGAEAPATATALAGLGYDVALFRDSDVDLTVEQTRTLAERMVQVFAWPDQMATEQRVLADIGDAAVQQLLEVAFETRGQQGVLDSIRNQLEAPSLSPVFSEWAVPGANRLQLRQAIATVAIKQSWFKKIGLGLDLGNVVATDVATRSHTPLAQVLAAIEAWSYD